MNFDISHILDQWEYQPGQVVVRRFIGRDGIEKIQLRVDLGLFQMNAHGRPDGKRPFGHPTLFDYFVTNWRSTSGNTAQPGWFLSQSGGLREAATRSAPVSSPLHLPFA